MDTVQNDAFVTIEYTLTLGSGEVVDKSPPGQPLGFIVGKQQIIPGLERALLGKALGAAFIVEVPAADGYGEVDQEMIQTMARKSFPDDMTVEVGMEFQAHTPHGPVQFRVVEAGEEEVVVDFNHPLAGEDLSFDVKVVGVRAATEEDLHALHGCGGDHGGGHGCGGCHCG